MCMSKASSVAFKRILLGCVALQRLTVWASVAIPTFCSPVKTSLTSVFDIYNPGLLIACVIILPVLLGLLYRLRRKWIMRWFILVLFSATEAAIWIGFDVLLGTNVKFFNSSFTLTWTVAIFMLETIRSRKQSKVAAASTVSRRRITSAGAWIDPSNDPSTTPGNVPRMYIIEDYEFLKIYSDGTMAFLLVGAASSVLYVILRFVPVLDFGTSLGFQLVLVVWFILDLRRLDQILGNDEATHGVIYVYVDAVLAVGYVVMIAGAISTMVLFIAGFVMSGPAFKSIKSRCAGFGGGGGCSCSDYPALHVFSGSKCLFFNDEGSSFDCCDSTPDEVTTNAESHTGPLEQHRTELDQIMQRD
ncbi:hypothetical protein GN244_ATG08950 [Phytophthora infestans]|nr:hypothetical protein GN244_ATG08950 [Phytophthora infestans]